MLVLGWPVVGDRARGHLPPHALVGRPVLRARPDWSGTCQGSTCKGLPVGCARRCLSSPGWTLGLAQRAVLAHRAELGTGRPSTGAQDGPREVVRIAHAQAQGSDAAVGAPTGRVRPASPSATCACADRAIWVREKLGQVSFSSLPTRRDAGKKPHNEAAAQLIGSARERALGWLTWFWSKWTR